MIESQQKSFKLVLKSGVNKEQLINKFKAKQMQREVQQALIYLKLKQHECPSKKALIFAKKKSVAVDGTAQKDGPAKYKKLVPFKPDSELKNGWLRGQKLKYKDAICFSEFEKKHSSNVFNSISAYNKKSRQEQEIFRIKRSQSSINFNLKNTKDALQKIALIKDNVMKERQIMNLKLKYNDLQLIQTTKFYTQQIPKLNTKGLIVKACAFQRYLNDQNLKFVNAQQNNKFIKNFVNGQAYQKRNQILNFNQKLNSMIVDQDEQKSKSSNNNKSKQFKKRNRNKSIYLTIKKNQFSKNKKQLNKFQQNIQKIIINDYFSKNQSFKQQINSLNNILRQPNLQY